MKSFAFILILSLLSVGVVNAQSVCSNLFEQKVFQLSESEIHARIVELRNLRREALREGGVARMLFNSRLDQMSKIIPRSEIINKIKALPEEQIIESVKTTSNSQFSKTLDGALEFLESIAHENNVHNDSPLHFAISKRRDDLIDYFIKAGYLMQKNRGGMLPAHYAARSGNKDVLLKLLDADPNKNYRREEYEDNLFNNSPLLIAIQKDSLDLIRALKKYNFDVNAKINGTINNPILDTVISVSSGREMFKVLEELGYDFTATNKYNIHSIHQLVKHKDPESLILIEEILKKHPSIVNNVGENLGRTPVLSLFDQATNPDFTKNDYKNFVATLDILIKYGADLNISDDQGHLPLRLAFRLPYVNTPEVVKKLIAGGADKNLVVRPNRVSPLLYLKMIYSSALKSLDVNEAKEIEALFEAIDEKPVVMELENSKKRRKR